MTAILYVETAKRVEYDPETGIMIWKYDPFMPKSWNTKHAGKRCGTIKKQGRTIGVAVDGISHTLYCRRLAYLISYGELPDFVGVVDGDRFNDAASNLKAMSYVELARKKKTGRCNTSGVLGVSFLKKSNKWLASISINNSVKGNSKCFTNKDDAETWVKQRRAELGFNPELHGRG